MKKERVLEEVPEEDWCVAGEKLLPNKYGKRVIIHHSGEPAICWAESRQSFWNISQKIVGTLKEKGFLVEAPNGRGKGQITILKLNAKGLAYFKKRETPSNLWAGTNHILFPHREPFLAKARKRA